MLNEKVYLKWFKNTLWIIRYTICFFVCLSRDEVEVRLGEYDTQVDDGREVFLRAESIIIHPHFDEVTFDSDIALIKLRQPITYTDHIVPCKYKIIIHDIGRSHHTCIKTTDL